MKQSIIFLAMFVMLCGVATAIIQDISLQSPSAGASTSNLTPAFMFFSYSDSDLVYSCELYINLSGYGKNISVNNNSVTTIVANASLSEGDYVWFVKCIDSTSNINSLTRNLNVDTTKPSLTFVSPTDSGNLTRINILINITASDLHFRNMTLYLYNGSGALINNTFSNSSNIYANYSVSTFGTYFFNATVYDQAGNSNSSDTRNVSIFNNAPIINSIATNPENTTRDLPFFIAVNVTDIENDTIDFVNVTITNPLGINTTYTTNLSDGLYVTQNITALNGTYFVNVTAYEWSGNTSATFNFTPFNAIGSIEFINMSDWTVTMLSNGLKTQNFTVFNNGTYADNNCVVVLTQDFTAWTFYSFNIQNFSLAINETKNLVVQFQNPPPASYKGYLNITCVGTLGGALVNLPLNNSPYVQLAVQQYIPPQGGGGGGGGTPPIVVVTSEQNETLFSISTDTGSPVAILYMYPAQKRQLTYIINSMSDYEQAITITCVGTFCPHVTFSKDSVMLPPNEQVILLVDLDMPSSAQYGQVFQFDFVVSDNAQHSGRVQNEIDVSKISKWYSKFSPFVQRGDSGYWFTVGTFNVPKLILYFIVVMIAVGITYFSIPNEKKYKDVASLIYVIAGLLAFIIMSLIY
jgi:hypothetical protein